MVLRAVAKGVRAAVMGFALVATLALAAIGYWMFKQRDGRERPGLTGEIRTTFVDASVKACEASQLQHPDNKGSRSYNSSPIAVAGPTPWPIPSPSTNWSAPVGRGWQNG